MTTALSPIRDDVGNAAALAEIERLWGAPRGSPKGDRLEVLMILVEAYEKEHHPMDPPDAIEAIKFRLEQLGLKLKDLEPLVGGRVRVAEILGRKRALSLAMIRKISANLGVPAEILIVPTVHRRASHAGVSRVARQPLGGKLRGPVGPKVTR